MFKRFKFWLGYKYLVNHNTKEIHVLKEVTTKCRLAMMSNKEVITSRKVKKLLNKGYNGCRHCYKEEDEG